MLCSGPNLIVLEKMGNHIVKKRIFKNFDFFKERKYCIFDIQNKIETKKSVYL